MNNLANSENDVLRILMDFQKQLNPILKSNQIIQDYTLLNGFINFVHSKISCMISDILLEQRKLIISGEREAVLDSFESEKNDNKDVRLIPTIDTNFIAKILDLLWVIIEYPVFKWFQAWGNSISRRETNPKDQKFVEFRQMNSKLTKYFKSVHKFHYGIIENILTDFDISSVVSSSAIKELNIKEKSESDKVKLNSESPQAVLLIIALHRCILYIGSSQRYKTMGEKVSNKFIQDNFKKSLRYFDIASLILPSVGETYLQKGMIYIQTDNYGTASYEFIRSILSRIPSTAGLINLNKIIYQPESSLRDKFIFSLSNIHKKEISGERVSDRLIVEYYFLALFSSKIAPCVWIDKDNSKNLVNGIGLNHLEKVMYKKISGRYSKITKIIFQNFISVIGGFEYILLKEGHSQNDIKHLALKDLTKPQLNYLNFAFDFISHIIEEVVMKSWEKNMNSFEYLAMIRIVECWIKTNRYVIQYSHRNETFCYALVRLFNSMICSQYVDLETVFVERPKRAYYFEEDIILKEFSSVKYALTDFNDDAIFNMDNSPNRLVGHVNESESLTKMEESKLRISSILYSGKKFFFKNSCGIEWDENNNTFKLPPKKISKNLQVTNVSSISKEHVRGLKEQSGTWRLNKQEKMKNVIGLENKLMKYRNTSKQFERGYSGSSTPIAPESFTFKPSFSMTNKQSIMSSTSSDSVTSYDSSTSGISIQSVAPKLEYNLDLTKSTSKQIHEMSSVDIIPETKHTKLKTEEPNQSEYNKRLVQETSNMVANAMFNTSYPSGVSNTDPSAPINMIPTNQVSNIAYTNFPDHPAPFISQPQQQPLAVMNQPMHPQSMYGMQQQYNQQSAYAQQKPLPNVQYPLYMQAPWSNNLPQLVNNQSYPLSGYNGFVYGLPNNQNIQPPSGFMRPTF